MQCVWDAKLCTRLHAEVGDPAFQTMWEFLTLLLAVDAWAPRNSALALRVRGDNTGALQDALRMKGRGMMNHIAREFTWRKAVWGWCLEFEHWPSELNTRADALSRLAAPGESGKYFPPELTSVPESIHADWGDGTPGFWRTWLEAPPPARA